MSRWFRMYEEILDDPKLQRLPPELFRTWVNALALTSRSNGALPSISECAFAFRETESSVSSAFHALVDAGLFVTDGETFQPKNWKKRQYKSDTSTERVRKFRKRSRNVTETAPETETDTEYSVTKVTATARRIDPDKVMFDSGVHLLSANGKTERQARSLIGKWRRDYGGEAVIAAIGRANRYDPSDPVEFITAALKRGRSPPDESSAYMAAAADESPWPC